MSYAIGARVEVLHQHFLGRWIMPLEMGTIIGRHTSPAGQEVYDVRLDIDKREYVFAPAEISDVTGAPWAEVHYKGR